MTTADTKKRKLLTVDDIKPSLRGIFYARARLLPRFVKSFLSFFLLLISFAAWEIESIVGIEFGAKFCVSARKIISRLFLSLIQQQANGYPSCGQKLASGTTRKCSQ